MRWQEPAPEREPESDITVSVGDSPQAVYPVGGVAVEGTVEALHLQSSGHLLVEVRLDDGQFTVLVVLLLLIAFAIFFRRRT